MFTHVDAVGSLRSDVKAIEGNGENPSGGNVGAPVMKTSISEQVNSVLPSSQSSNSLLKLWISASSTARWFEPCSE